MDLAGPAPLLVTADPDLLDVVQSLAAGAGVAPCVASDAAAALRAWAGAPLVVVGSDLAAEVALVAPGRRDGVHVVSPVEGGGDALLRWALALGAESVLELPSGAGRLGAELADVADPRGGRGVVVGVVGGSGGAGATTLACALGQVAGRAGPALVVDADACGPGVDRVLGLDDLPGVRWGDLAPGSGRLGASSLRDAVPRRDGIGVLTWAAGEPGALHPAAVREAVAAGRRGHVAVVVDLPRSALDRVDDVLGRCDLVVVVVRPGLAGVASAARLVATHVRGVRAGVVVRRVPRGIPADEVGAAVGLPVLVEMGDQRGVDESVELGLGPVRRARGPLFRAAAELLVAAERAGAPA